MDSYFGEDQWNSHAANIDSNLEVEDQSYARFLSQMLPTPTPLPEEAMTINHTEDVEMEDASPTPASFPEITLPDQSGLADENEVDCLEVPMDIVESIEAASREPSYAIDRVNMTINNTNMAYDATDNQFDDTNTEIKDEEMSDNERLLSELSPTQSFTTPANPLPQRVAQLRPALLRPRSLTGHDFIDRITFIEGYASLSNFPGHLRNQLTKHCETHGIDVPDCAKTKWYFSLFSTENCRSAWFEDAKTGELLQAARYKYGKKDQIIVVQSSRQSSARFLNGQAAIIAKASNEYEVAVENGRAVRKSLWRVWRPSGLPLGAGPAVWRVNVNHQDIQRTKLSQRSLRVVLHLPADALRKTQSTTRSATDQDLRTESRNQDEVIDNITQLMGNYFTPTPVPTPIPASTFGLTQNTNITQHSHPQNQPVVRYQSAPVSCQSNKYVMPQATHSLNPISAPAAAAIDPSAEFHFGEPTTRVRPVHMINTAAKLSAHADVAGITTVLLKIRIGFSGVPMVIVRGDEEDFKQVWIAIGNSTSRRIRVWVLAEEGTTG